MEDSRSNRFEICDEDEDEVEFTVRFDSLDDVYQAADDLLQLKSVYRLMKIVRDLRNLCQTDDGQIYIPKEGEEIPKARWVTLAAAASFPNGVPRKLIMERSGLSASQLIAYCTSKNNPTSKYLHVDSEMIYIIPEGIDWVMGLLKKDGQIEEEVE